MVDKSNLAHMQDKIPMIEEALSGFLEENGLSLSAQNFERARAHLLPCLSEYKDLNVSDVRQYIKELVEYNEFVIDGMNKSGISEDSLVHILVSADDHGVGQNAAPLPANSNWRFRLSQIPLPIAVSLFLLVGFAVATPLTFQPSPSQQELSTEMSREIGVTAIGELKSLVADVVMAEAARGKKISTAKVWNMVKAAPEITRYGYSSSYKSFNQGQYLEAKRMLIKWMDEGV